MAASSVDTGVASTYKERGAAIDLRGSKLEPGEGVRPALRVLDERDYVEFWPAGVATTGWFLCATCGNTVIVRQVLRGA